MRLFRSLAAFSPSRCITATVGSYDGVHCGHRVLLRQVVDEARRSGGESLVVTFSPHPRLLLEKEPDLKLLTSPEEKFHLLEQLGIDNLVVNSLAHVTYTIIRPTTTHGKSLSRLRVEKK